MTNALIVAGILWIAFLSLVLLAEWLANRLEGQRAEYRCNVTGTVVRPLGVGTPQLVSGMRYCWWQCPTCDRSEKQRHEAGFDQSRPGVHLTCLDDLVIRPVWRSKWKRAA